MKTRVAQPHPDMSAPAAVKLLREAADLLERGHLASGLSGTKRLERAAALYELIRPEHRAGYLTLAGFLRRQVEEDVRGFFEHAGEHGHDGPLYEAVAEALGVTRGSVQNLRNPTRPGPNRRRPDPTG